MSTVVAIDGPAGSGKSTVAQLLAAKLGFTYVNTGSLYRAVAWAALNQGIAWDNVPENFVDSLDLRYRNGNLLVNGVDPGAALRSAEIAAGASCVSKLPCVRAALLPVQKNAAASGWIVMEGRDIGSVVFPDAECKFFVTASLAERARRRLAQKGEVSTNATIDDVMQDIAKRDEQDSNRAIAPLKKAPDAVEIITDGLTPDEVVDLLAGYIRPHLEV